MSGLTVPMIKAGRRSASGYPITQRTISSHPIAVADTVRRSPLKLGKRTNSQLMRGKRAATSRATALRRPMTRSLSGVPRQII